MRSKALAMAFGAAIVALGQPASARAMPATSGVRVPQRLTAGDSDDFLGTLTADGEHVVFVSNRNATVQIFRQQRSGGRPQLIVDDEADVSFPRLSPDGSKVLYISTREDASGDVCVRPAKGGARRCLTGPATAEIQAFWYPDGQAVGVVGRRGLAGNIALRKIPLSGGKGSEVHPGNLSSPALSADGRWLVWVPVNRGSNKVGVAFSMRVGRGLRLRRAGGGKEIGLRLALPGVTGFPAFSLDGRWLYFTQYLSDTNFDGRIDGDDNSVLFRVAFNGKAADPLAGAQPVQLTTARWNCQYPAPARDRVLMTCHYDGSLDVYEMPLDGAVPANWSAKKLQEALDASRDNWERLMLLDHLRRVTSAPRKRLDLYKRSINLHLARGELASAAFYNGRLKSGPEADATDRGLSAITSELIAHRHEELRLNRGQLNDSFIAEQRARLRRVDALASGAPAAVRELAAVAAVEILDVIGAEGEAHRRMAAIDPAKVKDRFVLELYADRPLRFLREMGHRPALLKAVEMLAQHFAFDNTVRLLWSEILVEEVLRGTAVTERPALVAAWSKRLQLDSEAAFRFELEAMLLRLRPETRTAVMKQVFKLYRQHTYLPERRALVSAAVRRAAETDSAKMLYTFANSWASWVSRKHVERDSAVALYRQVVMERGYVRADQKRWLEAHGSFFGLTMVTDDLEATVGVIDAAARARRKGEVDKIRRKYKTQPDHPVLRFVQAYALVRGLPALKEVGERSAAYDDADTHLAVAARGLPRDPAVHHLRGHVAHRRFLDGLDKSAAFAAHAHYAMALDLSRDNARYRAATLHAMGLLQGAVGNHWLALESLDERRRLPFLSPISQLSVGLARARSLFHVGRATAAARAARQAYKLVRRTADAKRWIPLTLDRAALYSHMAGEHKRGAALYRTLVPMLGRSGAPAARQANQLRAALMEGAALLADGQAEAALSALGRARRLLAKVSGDDLQAGVRPYEHALQLSELDYRLFIDGLQAQAQGQAGKDSAAAKTLQQRRAALQTRLDDGADDGVLLQLAAVELQLAAIAGRAGDKDAAARRLEAGLAHTTRYAERTGTNAPPERLALIRAYAELHLYGRVPLRQLRRDLVAELGEVYAFLCAKPNPKRAAERFVFAIYLTMLRETASPSNVPAKEKS